jgi:hypothetical protein
MHSFENPRFYSSVNESSGGEFLEKPDFTTIEQFLGQGKLDMVLGLRAPFIRGPGLNYNLIPYIEQRNGHDVEVGRSEIRTWVEGNTLLPESKSQKGEMKLDYAQDGNICSLSVTVDRESGLLGNKAIRSVVVRRGEGIEQDMKNTVDYHIPESVQIKDKITIVTTVPFKDVLFDAPFLTDIADTKEQNAAFIYKARKEMPEVLWNSPMTEVITVDPTTYQLRTRVALLQEVYGGRLYRYGINGQTEEEFGSGKTSYKESLL